MLRLFPVVICYNLIVTDPKSILPLLVYDGDCGFCRLWVERWKVLTGDRVSYAPEKGLASVQLRLSNGEVYSGAEAVFRLRTYMPNKGWLLWLYNHVFGFAAVSEWAYRLIAGHRHFFSHVTRWLWGKNVMPSSYIIARWLFLRLLGIIYFIAFVSLLVQLSGLIGSNGILPAENFLEAVRAGSGAESYLNLPTLAWLSASDGFLHFLAFAGAALAVLLILGIAQAPVLILLWILYLSLTNVGQVFLSFQWDILLLEVGFLAIFLAPWRLLSKPSRESQPRPLIVWLFHWLLFRFIFLSGIVKLASGDPTWRNLTALNYHYETQPLPTIFGWYAHQLPSWFQAFSVVATFVMQLGIVFLIFAPRRLRFFAGGSIIFFETLILITGNYTFFNFLTIGMALLLFDDAFWRRLLPKKFVNKFTNAVQQTFRQPKLFQRVIASALAVVLVVGGASYIVGSAFGYHKLPRPIIAALNGVMPFHIVNPYGLFAVMTTSRPEISIEGSDDGEAWRQYEFKYKPGDLAKPPKWVAPHQPRLDWQMWFAALGTVEQNPWFLNLAARLLQGSPEVLALFKHNPFPDKPPKFIRALVYNYRFTDLKTKREQGVWWNRELQGLYLPPVKLQPLMLK